MNYEQESLSTYVEEMGKILDRNGKAFKFDELVYDNLNLIYGDKTVGEKIEQEDTIKNTYFYSYLLAIDAPKSKLIKGNIAPNNFQVQISHAWVEKGEFVYDVLFKRVFYKDFYYKHFNADVEKVFDSKMFKKPINLFNVGLQTVKNQPDMIKEFLSFESFKYLNKSAIMELLPFVKNEEVCKKIAEFYDIDITLVHNN